jgi:hypothetical protein
VQKQEETFDSYLAGLRKLASSCDYGNLEDEMIRDNIVYGITSDSVRAKLLREKNLTLEGAIDTCRSSERADSQAKLIKKTDEASINFTRNLKKMQGMNLKKCKFCGKSHPPDRNHCPAFGETCKICEKKNHFASCCRSKSKESHKTKPRRHKTKYRSVHAIAQDDSSSGDN